MDPCDLFKLADLGSELAPQEKICSEPGTGPGSSVAAAPRRGAALSSGLGPDLDLGLDPGTGAGFCQSTVYVDGGWFIVLDTTITLFYITQGTLYAYVLFNVSLAYV